MKCNRVISFLSLCCFAFKCETKQFVASPLEYRSISNHLKATKQIQNTDNLGPIKPGSKAQGFQLWTLNNGLVTYPSPKLPGDTPIGFHSFTNRSGFLECMWTSSQSLNDFVSTSPPNVRYVFMTFDPDAAEIVSWMRNQLNDALLNSKLTKGEQTDFLSRCFFVITPLFEIGNWIPSILSDWSCSDHGCGYNQLLFYSENWNPTVFVSKRVDARYDWVFNHKWSPSSLNVQLSTEACHTSSNFNLSGSVVLIADDTSTCSIAKQVQNLQLQKAAGVLVYSRPGYPPRDLNCDGTECDVAVQIPVASIPYDSKLLSTLSARGLVNVSLQTTPSPNFYFTINSRGEVVEPGWFLYPSMQFMAWQMQWLVFDNNLNQKISQLNDYVVTVFNKTTMQGKNGTGNVSVTLHELVQYDQLFIDASLSCESDRDEGCPPWDHVPQLFMCCEGSVLCNVEIGRWITSFRRGIGHWLTDISPLLPLFSPSDSSSKCTFLMKTDAWWAQPWVATVILRFQKPQMLRTVVSHNADDISRVINSHPHEVIPLFEGGVFDKTYNAKYQPIELRVPPNTVAAYVFAVITGHGSDNNGCGEFCVTSHTFVLNSEHKHTTTFNNAGTPLGCADRVAQGVVPNEHGTWLYGRDGWCDGQQVEPWLFEITNELSSETVNNISYFGLFNGKDPNPTENPGLIRMVSYLIYYTTP